MCGIAGIYGFSNKNLLKKISNELKHRGPDSEGFFLSRKVSLLNRRLAIIDIKGGNQPMFNEDKTLVVVYNGEIYNFLDLKKKLQLKGHFFKTKSDTEVILHAYEQWGEKAFDKFNGMFAIALYDKRKKQLILARDHFGIKPLYYAYDDEKFIFCSEIKPILSSKIIKKEPNDKIIYRYLIFRVHDDTKETFFQNIYRVMPGEMITIKEDKKNNKIKIFSKKYTQIEENLKEATKINKKINQEIIHEVRNKLKEIVSQRLITEVPVGSCLSGGIDSSTIVKIINQILRENHFYEKFIGKYQKTFSAVFPNYNNNEERYINILVKENKITNYKTYPTSSEFLKDLYEFIKVQEEPVISTGPYAQYCVFKLAKNYVKVVLDGQGLDEILAGYYPYYLVFFKQLIKEKRFYRLVKELWFSKKIVLYLLKQYLFELLNLKKRIKITQVLKKDFLEKFKNEKFSPITDNLKMRLIEDIFYNSLPALLRYEDKNSMHFSIEGRVPFLDYNFVSFLFSLSDRAIINDGKNKFIIREVMKEYLPKEVLNRSDKIGFTTPEYDWFFQIKDKILEIFSSESFAQRKYFDQKEVILAFIDFLNKKTSSDTLLFWRILNIELWMRIFFDKDKDKNEKEGLLLKANKGKKIKIRVNHEEYLRYPIKTKIIKKNENLFKIIPNYVINSIKKIQLGEKKFFVVISEKIVAISQGRSYFLWEIKPSIIAKLLSYFVTKTPYGIGLGSPWTMELAIKEVGILKILLASFLSMIGRFFGSKGIFYKIAGKEISAIDGPTSYSVFPSNISAKLPPKEPIRVAETIHNIIFEKLEDKNNFLGVVVIDANDIGQKVLANTTALEDKLIEKIFTDNPMGQSNEMTPLVLVVFN